MGEVWRARHTALDGDVALRRPWSRASSWSVVVVACLSTLLGGCAEPQTDVLILTAELPLHLEDHLEAAAIEGSEVPTDVPEPMAWHFDEQQPNWKPAGWGFTNVGLTIRNTANTELARLRRTEEVLQLLIGEENRDSDEEFVGALYVDLPDLAPDEWGQVAVEARVRPGVSGVMLLGFNLTEPAGPGVVQARHQAASPLAGDGTVQTYVLSAEPNVGAFDGTWRQLVLGFVLYELETGGRSAALDILSVKIIPKEAAFASSRAGISVEARGGQSRRTLFMHAPGRLVYQIRIPQTGRLDIGLGAVTRDDLVTYRITATRVGEDPELLFEEASAETEHWEQRQVDLSHLAGETVTLALEATADRAGTVALWAAPTLTGDRLTDKPNVIFYVIDGAGADYMSVYGYNRRTTPHLERLALEGAIFERAYSNSSWTRPSTPSFLTSLQHSVLGGLKNGRNVVPDQALTIAEHAHLAGYQTAEFTSNPNAGQMSGLDRGNDVFRDAGANPSSTSSIALHEDFWRWREAYPGEPYWTHFQTTDVHWPHASVAPFAGLFVSAERRRVLEAWDRRLGEASGAGVGVWGGNFEETGIDRVAYMSGFRDLYDEDMAHQDDQLGRLVAQLKAAGEWERTLLIVAADHGAAAGSQDWEILMRDDVPPNYDFVHRGTPIFRSGVSRIPLIIVWPERIAPGQRFSEPVSMIDMLPTILDLVDLPMPAVMQGQSLAPLLLGEQGWEPRPVIFDEFEVDATTGELGGRLEVVDGRWGASLEINPLSDPGEPGNRRPAPLLLYDLWNDPQCLNSLHDERPDLVEKYTEFLEAQWEAHQLLAKQFTPGTESPLTPEQLRTLRSLGYIR